MVNQDKKISELDSKTEPAYTEQLGLADGGITKNMTLANATKNVPYNYLIYLESSTYKARNGFTGVIDYSGVDFSVVLQAVLDNLTASRTTKEKVIIRCNATLNAEVTIPSYTIIEIAGKITAKTGLNNTGSMFTNDDTVGGNSHIEIYGGIIDHDESNQSGGSDETINTIYFDNVNQFNIHDVTILNAFHSGLRFENCTNGIITKNLINISVDDCIAVNDGCSYITISNNQCLNAGGGTQGTGGPNGIEIQDGASLITCIGNVCQDAKQSSGSGGNGISVNSHASQPAVHDCTISNNICEGNESKGIDIAGDTATSVVHYNIIVSNNICRDNLEHGIELNNCITSTISQNNCYSNNESGINEIGSESDGRNIFNGNICELNGFAGIALQSTHDNQIITNNICNDNGQAASSIPHGIVIQGDSNLCSNNVCNDTGGATQEKGILIVVGGNNNLITFNQVIGNTGEQIDDNGSNNIVLGNDGFTDTNDIVKLTETQTITNKTIAGGSNTLNGITSITGLGIQAQALDMGGFDIDMKTTGARIDLDTDNDSSLRASGDDTIVIEAGAVDTLIVTAGKTEVQRIAATPTLSIFNDNGGGTGTLGDLDWAADKADGTKINYGRIEINVDSDNNTAPLSTMEFLVQIAGGSTLQRLFEIQGDNELVRTIGANTDFAIAATAEFWLDGKSNTSFREDSADIIIAKAGGVDVLAIRNDDIAVPQGGRIYFDGVDFSGNTYWHSNSGDILRAVVGGEIGLRLQEIGTEINVICGADNALATNATNGFLYIPSMAGTPSGTPSAQTGKVAMVYDTTGEKLWIYNGAWVGVVLA